MGKSINHDKITAKGSTSFCVLRKRFPFLFVIDLWAVVLFFIVVTFSVDAKAQIKLSAEEAAWLKEHPVIRHAPDPDYAPFEYRDKNNRCSGVAPDFLKLVGKKLNVQFKDVSSPSWATSLENVKQHKADLVTVATKTPERSEYMLFTSPYIKFKNVILVHNNVAGYFILADFAGQTIAGIKGWAITGYIQKKYPDIKIHWVKSVKEALEVVSEGIANVVLLNRATAGYWMAKTEITNLRIAGETDYTYKLSFASRKDWPQFNSLLEKALKDISRFEREEIIDKWTFSMNRGWRPGTYTWYVLGGIFLLLFIVGPLLWSQLLQRKGKSQITKSEK